MSKIIMCIDMDAFFASVEQQDRPHLKEKPVAVIGAGARTVITTASYEARALGIKTGMNIYEARRLCPNLIFIVGDNEKYIRTCKGLVKIYSQFTPDVEVYSIDEAFLDITTTHHLFRGPEAIGGVIKRMVKEEFGIACTVGIGPNTLIAKLASNIAKPDGLRWIRPEEIEGMLKDMPVADLWGIGPKIAGRLEALGIRTCGELGKASVSLLRNRFGIIGETLKKMGMGICDRPVIAEEAKPKSIGHSMTLPADIWERGEIEAYILKLSEMVGRRARRHSYIGKGVSLTLRYSDFETFSRQTTLSRYTNDTHIIYKSALMILNRIRLKKKIRLLGVCLSGIIEDCNQLPLLESEKRRVSLLHAVDAVNDRFGDSKLIWASSNMQEREADVISPAWRPSGVRYVDMR
ncbi:MAG: DNA polymerase IV [Nitrospirae bacterium]|nr:DNA polymerase IV [Nitrospirota bacterium]